MTTATIALVLEYVKGTCLDDIRNQKTCAARPLTYIYHMLLHHSTREHTTLLRSSLYKTHKKILVYETRSFFGPLSGSFAN